MKGKIAFALHGGATSDGLDFIKANETAYKTALESASKQAVSILHDGGLATEAVKASIVVLEDNELFNCAKGSALTNKQTIEMDALIVDGNGIRSGAVALLKNIKNPIKIAAEVMDKTKCILLGGQGALDFAKQLGYEQLDEGYFVTDHQIAVYTKAKKSKPVEPLFDRMHGTVGAVAMDKFGNLAAAASTGGTCMKQEGRIGDTPLLGAGAYANNNCCAAAATGDGEIIMKSLLTYALSCLMPSETLGIQEACNYLIHTKHKNVKGDLGIISIDNKGNIGIAFNSKVMPRAWLNESLKIEVAIK